MQASADWGEKIDDVNHCVVYRSAGESVCAGIFLARMEIVRTPIYVYRQSLRQADIRQRLSMGCDFSVRRRDASDLGTLGAVDVFAC